MLFNICSFYVIYYFLLYKYINIFQICNGNETSLILHINCDISLFDANIKIKSTKTL